MKQNTSQVIWLAAGIFMCLVFGFIYSSRALDLPEVALPTPELERSKEIDLQNPKLKDQASVDELEFEVSLGDFNVSLMFSEDDINNLRRVLENYEFALAQEKEIAGDASDESDAIARMLADLAGDKTSDKEINEPLPNFFLSTILYRSPSQWAVWVNGQRYSAKQMKPVDKKEKEEEGLSDAALDASHKMDFEVTYITKTEARFKWRPKNLPRAIQKWEEFQGQKKMTKEERLINHLEAKNQSVEFDSKKGVFLFSMRANQTFDPEHMLVVEGGAKSLAPQRQELSKSNILAVTSTDKDKEVDVLDVLPEEKKVPDNNPKSKEKAAADELIGIYKNVGAALPRADPNSTNAE